MLSERLKSLAPDRQCEMGLLCSPSSCLCVKSKVVKQVERRHQWR